MNTRILIFILTLSLALPTAAPLAMVGGLAGEDERMVEWVDENPESEEESEERQSDDERPLPLSSGTTGEFSGSQKYYQRNSTAHWEVHLPVPFPPPEA